MSTGRRLGLISSLDGTSLNNDIRGADKIELLVHTDDARLLGYVELSEGPAYGRDIVNAVARAAAGAGLISVVLAAAVGWFASRSLTRPLTALTHVDHPDDGGRSRRARAGGAA